MPVLLFGCLILITRALALLFGDVPRALNAAMAGIALRSGCRPPRA